MIDLVVGVMMELWMYEFKYHSLFEGKHIISVLRGWEEIKVTVVRYEKGIGKRIVEAYEKYDLRTIYSIMDGLNIESKGCQYLIKVSVENDNVSVYFKYFFESKEEDIIELKDMVISRRLSHVNNQIVVFNTLDYDLVAKVGTGKIEIEDINKEINILRQLRHKNIIQVKQIVCQERYIVGYTMEYMDNSLEYIIVNNILYDKREIIMQLLEAVEYLHSMHIIHCDIKPGNILIKNGVMQIIDFGSANYENTFTQAFSTPGYCPFEGYGKCKITTAYDVYSIGSTLWSIYHNRIINNVLEILENKKNKLFIPMKIECKIEEVQYCIERSWKFEPEERITVQEIREKMNLSNNNVSEL